MVGRVVIDDDRARDHTSFNIPQRMTYKRRIIKSVIKSQRVDVVCLQETKIKEMSTGLVRSLGVGRNIEWRAVNSRGAAGGILVFWDNRVVELVGWEQGVFSI